MAVNNGYSYPRASPGADASDGESRETGGGPKRAMTPEHEWSSGKTVSTVFNPYYTGSPRALSISTRTESIDRQEIIRRKKAASRPSSPELERRKSPTSTITQRGTLSQSSAESYTQPMLSGTTDLQTIGLEIERPSSALHRGDFRQREQPESSEHYPKATHSPPLLATSPVALWRSDFPAHRLGWTKRNADREPAIISNAEVMPSPHRSRTISNASLASSFIYKPPTSPLAQSSRPDTPDISSCRKSRSPDKSRRHTFSPTSVYRFSPDPLEPTHSIIRDHVPPLRSEKTYPNRAYQQRQQSLDLSSYASLPHTALSATRHPSFSESPLHHAPMVGSYEESILRGRMSTTPSRPLNFVAQLGVLGKGTCKPSLRCPSHVSIPFPAVFYSYGSGNRAGFPNDQPSPYVGLIDLENSLPSLDASDKRRNQRLQAALQPAGSRNVSRSREESSTSENQAQRRKREKQKRRSGSPKAPPGGCYRIPQQGQLQIVIKNPNKTAVKLFLVPYDLSDMEPGQKTFIRQRSYSAGQIIDMPLSLRKNLGTDRPEAGINASGDPTDKPMLRYLIHLHICCPSQGRFYLYKSMRVVFANRVPDGKEKLRNEIQLPDPKYSTYKPGRDSSSNVTTPASKGTTGRRSEVDSIFLPVNESPWFKLSHSLAHSLPSTDVQHGYDLPMQALPRLPTLNSRPTSQNTSDGAMDINSDHSDRTRSPSSGFSSPIAAAQSDAGQAASVIAKLDKPFNFEADWVRERSMQMTLGLSGGKSENLLSKNLHGFAFLRGRDPTLEEAP